jgi:uncharacterized SAM-binding protein YcdF (DUF218 family)
MRIRPRDELEEYRAPPEEWVGRLPPGCLPHFVFVLVVVGGSLACVHYFAGKAMFDRTLMALATPVGIVWLLLLLAAYWVSVWRIRMASLLCWSSWLLLTLAGNSYISNQLITYLEAPYADIDPFQLDKFEAILVLGGGTDVSPANVPQLAFAGDRLGLAARLFHAGKAERIVVMEDESPGIDGAPPSPGPSEKILVELNVPTAAIVRLPPGADTSQEIQGLKAWMNEQSFQRVGILTSAWHLKRTMLLARRYEVTGVPIPAGFLGKKLEPGPGYLIPSAFNLFVTQLATKEIAGRWLDR